MAIAYRSLLLGHPQCPREINDQMSKSLGSIWKRRCQAEGGCMGSFSILSPTLWSSCLHSGQLVIPAVVQTGQLRPAEVYLLRVEDRGSGLYYMGVVSAPGKWSVSGSRSSEGCAKSPNKGPGEPGGGVSAIPRFLGGSWDGSPAPPRAPRQRGGAQRRFAPGTGTRAPAPAGPVQQDP